MSRRGVPAGQQGGQGGQGPQGPAQDWVAPFYAKQPWETGQEHTRFRIFRGLDPVERSLYEVAETCCASHGVTYDQIVQQAELHYWDARVQVWDQHTLTTQREWARLKEADALNRQLFRVGLAGQLLELELHNHLRELQRMKAEGVTTPVHSLRDLIRLMDVQTKLERLCQGESTENVTVAGQVDAPDYSALTTGELQQMAEFEQRALEAAQRNGVAQGTQKPGLN